MKYEEYIDRLLNPRRFAKEIDTGKIWNFIGLGNQTMIFNGQSDKTDFMVLYFDHNDDRMVMHVMPQYDFQRRFKPVYPDIEAVNVAKAPRPKLGVGGHMFSLPRKNFGIDRVCRFLNIQGSQLGFTFTYEGSNIKFEYDNNIRVGGSVEFD